MYTQVRDPANGFPEADMREQTYPPKRPNMAHFGAPAEQPPRIEEKATLQAVDVRGLQHETQQPPKKQPAAIR